MTDQQVEVLLDTVRELPPYLFIMLGLYSGLRREEILALQWDCVFLDESTPYISVRRAWRTEHNRPVISTVLKTKAAKRDIPIPKCLVDCLREAKTASKSDYVISDSEGQPLAASQFQRVWQYVVVRSTKPRNYYKYVNGQSIKYTVTPTLGMTQRNQPKIKYTLDFDVTPHPAPAHIHHEPALCRELIPRRFSILQDMKTAKQLWTSMLRSSIISQRSCSV